MQRILGARRLSRPVVLAGLFALYALITAVMVAPLFSYQHLASASYPGDPRLNIWTLGWVHHWLAGGAPSLYDANIFFPADRTLALSEPMIAIALVTWPLAVAFDNPVLSYNVAWWLSYPAAALAAHWMLYRYTRSHVAALLGACAYAFGFFRMLHGHAHLQLLWSCWIPLALVFLERWMDNPTWPRVALIGGAVLMQTLASWYLGVMAALALAILAIVRLGHAPGVAAARARACTQLAACAVIVGGCVWLLARPHLGLLAVHEGEASRLAASWRSYLLPPQDTWLAGPFQRLGVKGLFWSFGEQALFLGYTNLALAAVGAWAAWSRREHRRMLTGFAAIGLVALVLSLGPSTSVSAIDWTPFGLLTTVPGLEFFRVPARFGLLVSLALAVGVAFGVCRLLEADRARGLAVAWLLMALSLSESFLIRFPLGKPQPAPIPVVYAHLARDEAVGATVSLPTFRGTAQWWREADYQYYSTAHWRPLVNGYSRGEPDDHFWILGHMMAFPGPNSAKTMRRLGVRWVVVHADLYPDLGRAVLDEAARSPDFRLREKQESIYLFEVADGPAELTVARTR